jgi:hypothetical protein
MLPVVPAVGEEGTTDTLRSMLILFVGATALDLFSSLFCLKQLVT